MRNFIKPAGSPARHRARGLAAVVASVALAAGLGAYPAVQAEETTTVSDITTDDAGLPTYSWMDDDTPSSSATPSAPAAASASNPASASASKPAEAPATANPVTVERKGVVDRIVVNDPDGEAWEFGGKASKENIFALKREGKGEIKEVLSVTADGRKLEPYDYGYVNAKDGGFVAFNLNALHTIPPQVVEIEARTTDAGEYAIAESAEVPSEAELAESGYGKGRPAEAADGNIRATDQVFWSPEQRLSSPIIGAGRHTFEGLTGTKPYIEVSPSGSLPGQVGKDIRITRVILRNIQPGTAKPDLTWAIDKNNESEKYFGTGSAVKNASGQDKGVEIRFFDPETGESPITRQFLIWSGEDSLKIATKTTPPGWTTNLNLLKDRYEVEVYGSFKVNDERRTKIWDENKPDGAYHAEAKPIVSIRENQWNFELKQSIDEGGILAPVVKAEVPSGNTSYVVSSGTRPRLIVAGPDGSPITEMDGQSFGDSAQFELPNKIAIPKGATLTVRMQLSGDNARRDEVPNGPGSLTYIIEPNDNSAVPGPGGKFTEPKRVTDPEAIPNGGNIQFETVTTTPAGRAYFKVNGGPVTLESITLSNAGNKLSKDPSGSGFEILSDSCRDIKQSQLTSCQRYVWVDGQQVKVIENGDGSLTYKFDQPYTLEEGQRFALPFTNGKLESGWKISGSTPQIGGEKEEKVAEHEGKNPTDTKIPAPEESSFAIGNVEGKSGICLTTTVDQAPVSLGVDKAKDHPTLVQFDLGNSSDYRSGSIHIKRTDGKVFKRHTVVFEFTDYRNQVKGTNSLRSQVVRGWDTSEIIVDLGNIAKIYEANKWEWPTNRKYLNFWLNDQLPCGKFEAAIYKTQVGAEPSNAGQRVCNGIETQSEQRRAPIAPLQPGGVYVIASDIKNLPAGAEGRLDYRYSSQLYLQSSGDGQFEKIGESTPWVYNALSYNQNDNWLYAVSQPRGHDVDKKLTYLEDPCYPAGHLLQIDPRTGDVHDLGKVTKPGIGPTHTTNSDYGFQGAYRHTPTAQTEQNDLWGGLNTGVFDNDGRYWVANASNSGTNSLYLVDLDNVSAQMTSYKTRSEDLAALPRTVYPDASKYIWGLRSPSGGDNSKIYLERIDVETGEVKQTDVTDLVAPVTGFKLSNINGGRAPVWGKAWTYGNGDLGFGTGGASHSTDSVRMRITNPGTNDEKVVLVSHGPAPQSYNTDGASSIATHNADLSVMKTRSEVWENGVQTKVNWVVRVTNESYGPSSGFEVSDILPNTIQNPAITAVVGSRSSWRVQWGPGEDKQVMRFTHGYLEPRSSIEIHLTADVKDAKAGTAACAPNFATLTPNDIDLNVDNNSHVDSPCVEKIGGKTTGPDEKGVYTATYTVKITNPMTEEVTVGNVTRPQVNLKYGKVVDTPQFPEGTQIVGAEWKGTDEAGEPLSNGSNSEKEIGQRPVLTLSEGGTIQTGKERNFHQYDISVRFKVTDHAKLGTSSDPNTCQPGKTLFNHVSVSGAEDIACVPPPEEKMVNIRLAKISLDKLQTDDVLASGQLLQGAVFELTQIDAQGNPVEGALKTQSKYNSDTGTFDFLNLKPGKYRLYEAQAPAGYSLLVEPIEFTVTMNDDKAGIELDQRASVVARSFDHTKAPNTWKLTSQDAVLTVANVLQGNLPKTGGKGLQLPILLGGALIAAGALVGRRRIVA